MFSVTVTGRCFPIWGKKAGEACMRDSDCESGYVCSSENGRMRVCQPVAEGNAGLGKFSKKLHSAQEILGRKSLKINEIKKWHNSGAIGPQKYKFSSRRKAIIHGK